LKNPRTRNQREQVAARSARCHIPEDSILHNHRCENLKSYIDRKYRNRNICILLDIQTAIQALGNHQITSKLVWTAINPLYSWPDITESN
jgi:hypothetical protein